MKFETDNGMGAVCGNQSVARQCHMVATRGKAPDHAMTVEMDARCPFIQNRPKPEEKAAQMGFKDSNPEKTTQIGMNLSSTLAAQITDWLKNKRDVLAQEPSNMPGINPSIMNHRLSISPEYQPVRQKNRSFELQHHQAIKEETNKWLKQDFCETSCILDDQLIWCWLRSPTVNGVCVDFVEKTHEDFNNNKSILCDSLFDRCECCFRPNVYQ